MPDQATQRDMPLKWLWQRVKAVNLALHFRLDRFVRPPLQICLAPVHMSFRLMMSMEAPLDTSRKSLL